ncbi:MAG: glycosyltransferase, partial [Phycisphaerales bacterium]|nr:glycosyltransferase [Phycisphaerales bacterium]
RRPQDITSMKAEYGWPRQHREGYPDLVGPEAGFNQMVEQFNATHRNVQGVLVNQFGWSQELCGEDLPVEMTFGDLRRATDVEFGMATYEPFGISPLEPLGSGAVCVISNVCGCRGFVDEVTGGVEIDNVIVGDFTRLDRPWSIEELTRMTQADRDVVERGIASEVAEKLMGRLGEKSRRGLLESGQKLVKGLGWDQVVEAKLIPMLQRVMGDAHRNERAVMRAAKA